MRVARDLISIAHRRLESLLRAEYCELADSTDRDIMAVLRAFIQMYPLLDTCRKLTLEPPDRMYTEHEERIAKHLITVISSLSIIEKELQ